MPRAEPAALQADDGCLRRVRARHGGWYIGGVAAPLPKRPGASEDRYVKEPGELIVVFQRIRSWDQDL